MPFNIATAALILQNKEITYNIYCLSITELALVCLLLFMMVSQIIKEWIYYRLKLLPFLLILAILIFNIVYSVFIIQDYQHISEHSQSEWFGLSIAIIVVNSLMILGLIGRPAIILPVEQDICCSIV